MVGGQDELVFDGDSMVIDNSGRLVLRGRQFVEGIYITDLTLPLAHAPEPSSPHLLAPTPDDHEFARDSEQPRLDDLAEIYEALVLGLRDYVRKNRFTSVILGLSGGIDSALVAAIACDAIGATDVYGVGMPSRFSSDHSRTDAQDLAARCGLHFREIPIEPMFAAFMGELDLSGLAEENLQARIRGMILMSLSIQNGHLVLATGNKSEISVGYSTIYGDAVGGFAPIKDVPKTLVWELANWRNAIAQSRGETMPIPPNSIEKPPSAELRPDQLDADSLPDYAELDAILESYVSGDAGLAELIAQGHSPSVATRVVSLTDAAEYKRRQYPPGTKISLRAFGRDRRLPITNRWRED
jgi:NAD+ synthase (glutamine-hydrolysing)